MSKGAVAGAGVPVLNATNHASTMNHKTNAAQTLTIPHIDAKFRILRATNIPASTTIVLQNDPFVHRNSKHSRMLVFRATQCFFNRTYVSTSTPNSITPTTEAATTDHTGRCHRAGIGVEDPVEAGDGDGVGSGKETSVGSDIDAGVRDGVAAGVGDSVGVAVGIGVGVGDVVGSVVGNGVSDIVGGDVVGGVGDHADGDDVGDGVGDLNGDGV